MKSLVANAISARALMSVRFVVVSLVLAICSVPSQVVASVDTPDQYQLFFGDFASTEFGQDGYGDVLLLPPKDVFLPIGVSPSVIIPLRSNLAEIMLCGAPDGTFSPCNRLGELPAGAMPTDLFDLYVANFSGTGLVDIFLHANQSGLNSVLLEGASDGTFDLQDQFEAVAGVQISGALVSIIPETLSSLAQIDVSGFTIAVQGGQFRPTGTAIASTTIGAVAGSVSVDHGAASYSIPISVSPGTAGMQPQLSLNYASDRGLGIAGVGFSLSGGSKIERCGKSGLFYGQSTAVQMTAEDRACLDGNELINISGGYWSNGSEYRTRAESFSRIKYYESANDSYFIVETKDGAIKQYGGRDSSTAQSSSAVYRWALSKVSDRVGNYYLIDYMPDSRAKAPQRYTYTLNDNVAQLSQAYASIEFNYAGEESGAVGYEYGASYKSGLRLQSIANYVDGDLFREYILKYEYDENAKIHRVREVYECAADRQCLEPTTFEWTAAIAANYPNMTVTAPSQWGTDIWLAGMFPEAQYRNWVDINGDGVTDFCGIFGLLTYGAAACLISDGAGGFPTIVEIPAGIEGDGAFDTQTPNTSTWNKDPGWFDVDTDGDVDLCITGPNQGIGQIRCYLNNGTGTAFTEVGYQLTGMPDRERIGSRNWIDVNGDGYTDYCVGYVNITGSNNYVKCVENTSGQGFQAATSFTSAAGSPSIMFANINGDNLPDFCWTADGELRCQENIDGASFSQSHWVKSGVSVLAQYVTGPKNYGMTFADFNGDGLSDFCRVIEVAGGHQAGCVVSTGEGWGSDIRSETFETSAPGAQGWFDADDDGGIDWCFREQGQAGENLRCLSSYEGQFVGLNEYPLALTPATSTGQSTAYRLDAADLDGDGLLDICSTYAGSEVVNGAQEWGFACYTRNATPAPNYLVGIENGQGLRYELIYGSMADSTLYVRDAADTNIGAQAYALQPRNLVRSLGASDGIGGTNWRHYFYKNFSNDSAYGTSGFGYIEERSDAGDSVVKRWFRNVTQAPEIAGSEYKREEWLENSSGSMVRVLLEESEWVFDYRAGTDVKQTPSTTTVSTLFNASEGISDLSRYHVFLQESTQDTWELDGTHVGTSNTLNVLDDYGVLEQQTVTTSRVDQSFTKSLVNVIDNDADSWTLGRLLRSEVTQFGSYGADVMAPMTRVSAWTYYPSGHVHAGMVHTATTEPDVPALSRTTTYVYDQFGMKSEVTESAGGQSRTARVNHDVRGRYIVEEWNHYDHFTSHEYDPVLAKRLSTTGPNLLTKHWRYDAFGRANETEDARGNIAYSTINPCLIACPANAIYYTEVKTLTPQGVVLGAPSREYLDVLGRVVAVEKDVFGGKTVRALKEYDAAGYLVRNSVPHFVTTPQPIWSTVNSRDSRGRVLSSTSAAGLQEQTVYTALSVTTTTSWFDPQQVGGGYNEKVRTTLSDLKGNNRKTIDEGMAEVVFSYDAFDNSVLTSTEDGVDITQVFDIRGQRTAIDDPNTGEWKYAYGAFGEVVLQQDARGKRICSQYDDLGRRIARTDDFLPASDWASAVAAAQNNCAGQPATTEWFYDSAEDGLGRLSEVRHGGQTTEAYDYDGYGRVTSTARIISGQSFVTDNEYDAATGRLAKTRYPQTFETDRFSINYAYAATGELFKITDSQGSAYWELTEKDALGNVTGAQFSAGMIATSAAYDQASGHLQSTTAGSLILSPGLDNIVDMTFVYDAFGNLRQRTDARSDGGQDFAITETFGYDLRSRLVTNDIVSQTDPALNYGQSVTYADNGNILTKSGVGTYTYAGSCTLDGQQQAVGPHAVTGIAGDVSRDFCYDDAGNVVSDGLKTVEYTAFNKPDVIQSATAAVQFEYGSGRQLQRRTETVDGKQVDKYLLGAYEYLVETESGITTRQARYFVGGNLIITVKDDAPAARSAAYLFHDHQGSVVAIADAGGGVTERFAYDAWGYRRDIANWMMMSEASLYAMGQGEQVTEKGYTGHEMLDAVGLIHMGGRVYDPLVGRFLSPDIHVQAPENYQNYNRYSYVLNRPTSLTDPSGYSWWSDNVTDPWRKYRNEVAGIMFPGMSAQYHAFQKGSRELARFAARNELAGEIIGLVGVAACSFFTAGTATAACAGAYQGMATTSIAYGSGMSLEKALGAGLEAGALAYLNAEFAGAIARNINGTGLSGAIEKGVWHSARGAIFSGGDYRSGALGGFAQGMAEGAVASWVGDEAMSDMAIGAGITALIGGTTAWAGGGKFGNGAVTAAFGYLTNELSDNCSGQMCKKNRSARNDNEYELGIEDVFDVLVINASEVLSLKVDAGVAMGSGVSLGIERQGHDVSGSVEMAKGVAGFVGATVGADVFSTGPISGIYSSTTVCKAAILAGCVSVSWGQNGNWSLATQLGVGFGFKYDATTVGYKADL